MNDGGSPSMIESVLRVGAVLIFGLVCNAIVSIRCQAQAADAAPGAATTNINNINNNNNNNKSGNVIVPNWSRVLKDYVLIPAPEPDPQITGAAGPTTTAQI